MVRIVWWVRSVYSQGCDTEAIKTHTHTCSHSSTSVCSCNNAFLVFNSCPKVLEADSRWREVWKRIEQLPIAGERGGSGVGRHADRTCNVKKTKKQKCKIATCQKVPKRNSRNMLSSRGSSDHLRSMTDWIKTSPSISCCWWLTDDTQVSQPGVQLLQATPCSGKTSEHTQTALI